jgi:hypothetical protein
MRGQRGPRWPEPLRRRQPWPDKPAWSAGRPAVDQPTTLHLRHAVGWADLTVGTWRPRALAPPPRVQVLSVARAVPHHPQRPVTRWTVKSFFSCKSYRADAALLRGGDAPATSAGASRGWASLHD